MTYKIAEKFVSINGEGNRAGFLSVFIRFVGCNLLCEYCDTKWANEKLTTYTIMSADDIYRFVKETEILNVTLTGGEPLIQPNIAYLLSLLSKDYAINVEIETNGSVDISPFITIDNRPSFTIDYKLSSSGMESKMLLSNYEHLNVKDCVKFVVGSMDDLHKANQIINEYNLRERCGVHISPVYGNIEMKDIVEFMKVNRMNSIKFQPQLHKFIWNPELRGV